MTSLSKSNDRWIRLIWACLRRLGPESYDMTAPRLVSLTVCMLKAEVIGTLLYGCVTWTLSVKLFAKLRTAHHQVLLLRVIGFQRKKKKVKHSC